MELKPKYFQFKAFYLGQIYQAKNIINHQFEVVFKFMLTIRIKVFITCFLTYHSIIQIVILFIVGKTHFVTNILLFIYILSLRS